MLLPWANVDGCTVDVSWRGSVKKMRFHEGEVLRFGMMESQCSQEIGTLHHHSVFFWKHSSISDVVWDIGWPRPLVVLFLLERLNVKRRPASGVNPSETTKIYSFDLPTSSHLGSPEWALWPHPPREQSPGSLIHLLRWSAAHRSSADGWTSPW